MEDRVFAHGYGKDFKNGVGAFRGVITHEFAKRTFGTAFVGQEAAFDHDFSVSRNFQVDVLALAHRDVFVGQLGGDVHFVNVVGQGGSCGQEAGGGRSDQHGGFQRFAHRFGL